MIEEEAIQRRKENAELKEELARKDQRIEELEGLLMSALLRIEELERRLAKDSRNSSKSPSSDGCKRKGKKHPASGKAKGGQAGHTGPTLELVETPDQVVIHRPNHCETCQCELGTVAGQVKERRQIHDLPVQRLVVTEHRVEILTCPRCLHQTSGSFPRGVQAPAQYGPRVQALSVSLSQYQLLPMERIGEVFEDLLSCRLSEGTLVNWIQEAARTLSPTMLILKRLLLAQKLDHGGETGARVKGLLHWFHVNSTRWLTLYHWHRQRGQKAIDAIGILPEYVGRAIHDRWSSYDHYSCAHSVCGAPLLRDCLLVAEQDHQSWAQEMHDLLVRMSHLTTRFCATGAQQLPQAERDRLVLQYFAILQQVFAFHRMHAPPPDTPVPKKPGRRKQTDAKNLLDALLTGAEQVLAFLGFYAEAGLAKKRVEVSFYTSTLKIEYQETELAFYTIEWEDNKRIKEVKNPRLIETGYRSPQLTLWTLGPDEWLHFLKLPDYAARKKPQRKSEIVQLPLLDLTLPGQQAI